MPEHIVTATLDGDGAPFRVAATDLGIAAAGWEPDELEAFAVEVAVGGRVPVVPLAEADPDDPAAGADLARRDPDARRRSCGVATDDGAVAVDLADRPTFDRRVLDEVPGIGWGATASYGDIARRVGRRERRARSAVRSGGTRSRSLIPCHRIIAGRRDARRLRRNGWVDRDQRLSRKEALLLREGVTVPRRAARLRPTGAIHGAARGHRAEGSGAAGRPRRSHDGSVRARRPVDVRRLPQARLLAAVARPARSPPPARR